VRPEKGEGGYVVSFGALSKMMVRIGEGGKSVTIDTV